MAIRQVVQTDVGQSTVRRQSLIAVTVTEAQDIYATWLLVLRNGRHRSVTTQVSPDVVAHIVARPAFQAIIQQIADDTFPRVEAIAR
jgi:hypothetical protein